MFSSDVEVVARVWLLRIRTQLADNLSTTALTQMNGADPLTNICHRIQEEFSLGFKTLDKVSGHAVGFEVATRVH